MQGDGIKTTSDQLFVHVQSVQVSVQLRGAKKFPALLVLLVTGVGPSLQGRRQRINVAACRQNHTDKEWVMIGYDYC